jgi:uracil-DNA glycosylase
MMKKIIWNSYGLLHDNTTFDEIENQIEDERIYSVIEEIAFINIKKTPGGGSANKTEIRRHYVQNKDLLVEQVKAFKPNIIILGGTLTFFEYEDLEKANLDITKDNKFQSINESSKMSFYDISEDILLVNAYHPAYWSMSYKQYYEEMIDGLNVWKKIKHKN